MDDRIWVMIASFGGSIGFVVLCLWLLGRAANAGIPRMAARVERGGAAWELAAQRLSCLFTPPGAGGSYGAMSIRGSVDRTAITVDRHVVHENKSYAVYTRVTATPAIAPPRYELHVQEEDMRAVMSRLKGAIDDEIGDERFDTAFMVETNRAQLTRRILRPLAATLLDMPTVDLRFERGVVVTTLPEVLEDASALVRLVRTTVALAEAPARLLSSWEELARTLGGAVASWQTWNDECALPPIEMEPRGVRLRVEANEDGTVHLIPLEPEKLRLDAGLLTDGKMRVPSDPSAIDEAATQLAASTATQAYRS